MLVHFIKFLDRPYDPKLLELASLITAVRVDNWPSLFSANQESACTWAKPELSSSTATCSPFPHSAQDGWLFLPQNFTILLSFFFCVLVTLPNEP